MAKRLIIPDVHLKPKMFIQASELLKKGVADGAVVLGDLVDDWGEEFNTGAYERTMETAIQFHKAHPNTLWCMGNHDFGYYHTGYGKRPTGHSVFMEGIMGTWLREFERADIEQKVVVKEGEVLFSHAGLSLGWVNSLSDRKSPPIEIALSLANHATKAQLWAMDSPLWWRPQRAYDDGVGWLYPSYMQVVGHSPVKTPTLDVGEVGALLSCDTFSTYHNGAPYGDRHWVVVDTETGGYEDIGDYYDQLYNHRKEENE